MSAVKLMNYVTNKVAVAVGSNGGGFSLYELDASLKSRFEVPRSQPRLLSPSRVGWPASVKVTRNQNWDDFAAKGYRLAGLYGAIGASDAVIEERLQRLANGMEPTPGMYSPGYLLAYTCSWTTWCWAVAPDGGAPYKVNSKNLNIIDYSLHSNVRVVAFGNDNRPVGNEVRAFSGNSGDPHIVSDISHVNAAIKDIAFSNFDVAVFTFHMASLGGGKEALKLGRMSETDRAYLGADHAIWGVIAKAFHGTGKYVILNACHSDKFAQEIVVAHGLTVVAPTGLTQLRTYRDGTRELHIDDEYNIGRTWMKYSPAK